MWNAHPFSIFCFGMRVQMELHAWQYSSCHSKLLVPTCARHRTCQINYKHGASAVLTPRAISGTSPEHEGADGALPAASDSSQARPRPLQVDPHDPIYQAMMAAAKAPTPPPAASTHQHLPDAPQGILSSPHAFPAAVVGPAHGSPAAPKVR